MLKSKVNILYKNHQNKILVENILKKLRSDFPITPKIEKSRNEFINLLFPIKKIIENLDITENSLKFLIARAELYNEYHRNIRLKLYENNNQNIIISYNSDDDEKNEKSKYDLYCCNKIQQNDINDFNSIFFIKKFRAIYETVLSYKLEQKYGYFWEVLDWDCGVNLEVKLSVKKEGWDNI